MELVLVELLIVIGLFAAVTVMLALGHRIGVRRRQRDVEGAAAGVGVVNGAVFGLLGLLIAFTFSGAATRFDQRRALIVEEANAIGTAWLRLDLLPGDAQPGVRKLFRDYVDSRLQTYRLTSDLTAAFAEVDRSVEIQRQIWTAAMAALTAPGIPPQTAALVLPALNATFDLGTTRVASTRMHPPFVVFVMLILLVLGGALLAGHGMAGAKDRNRLHTAAFAGCMTLAVYVILDLEFPRQGLIRVDAADQILLELRQSMK